LCCLPRSSLARSFSSSIVVRTAAQEVQIRATDFLNAVLIITVFYSKEANKIKCPFLLGAVVVAARAHSAVYFIYYVVRQAGGGDRRAARMTIRFWVAQKAAAVAASGCYVQRERERERESVWLAG